MEARAILGVCFNTESLRSQKVIKVEAKESKVFFLQDAIDKVLSSGRLSPTLASTVVAANIPSCCTRTPLMCQSVSRSEYWERSSTTLSMTILGTRLGPSRSLS